MAEHLKKSILILQELQKSALLDLTHLTKQMVTNQRQTHSITMMQKHLLKMAQTL